MTKTFIGFACALIAVASFVGCGGGSMTDPRDGQTYKTVTIGSHTWMAENLKYRTQSSECYNNDANNCNLYGRLYNWYEAMKVCPGGWHLPNDNEWHDLWNAVGGARTAGSVLKSTGGWENGGNGNDKFGFAVLPAGYRDNYGGFLKAGYRAYFWSASENYSYKGLAYHWDFYSSDDGYGHDGVYQDDSGKLTGHTVRCIKD